MAVNTDQTIRVLLADDHAMVRAGIKQFIEQAADIRVVHEATNGRDVIDYLTQTCGSIDLVILDIKMPEKNGIETTQIIRNTFSKLPVLVLSAFDDDPYIKAVLSAGADGYMLKSATPAELNSAIRAIYRGESALSPMIAQKLIGQFTADEASFSLTEREVEMLQLLKEGRTNKEIAFEKQISSRTVQSHLANIYRKLEVSNRTEALSKAAGLGLIQL